MQDGLLLVLLAFIYYSFGEALIGISRLIVQCCYFIVIIFFFYSTFSCSYVVDCDRCKLGLFMVVGYYSMN